MQAPTGNIFFTSDSHFGHRNIIKYCERPFMDAQEMDREMVRRWNAKVKPEDLVYHLGDLTLEGMQIAGDVLCQLNGHLRVLSYPFDHDKRWLPRGNGWDPTYKTLSGWVSFRGQIVVVEPGDASLPGRDIPPIVLCHYPMMSWYAKRYKSWHLYGHIHATHPYRRIQHEWSLNVCADAWNFSPVSLAQVANMMAEHGYYDGDEWLNTEDDYGS